MKALYKHLLFVFLALYFTQIAYTNADDNRDFYKILGIKRSAKPRDIKKAFKKMSMKHHPDKNPGDETALKKYQDVSSAYDVLNDAEKRRKYDKCGEKCANEEGGGGGWDPWGGMFGRQQQEDRTGPTMTIKLKISLEDVYNGRDMEIKYTRSTLCPNCRGSGADNPDDVKDCPKCNGQGTIMQTQRLGPGFVQQFQTECPKCSGEGKVKTSTCHQCRAKKTMQALDEVYLFIEKGCPDGHEERFKDAADEFVNIRAGEVVLKIQAAPHKVFTREGDNLRMDVHITLRQALLGFEIEIPHLDDHKVTLSKQPGQITQHGDVQRIEDEGMPKYGSPSDFGDLFVKYHIKSPTSLSDGQKTMLKQFFQS